MSKISQCLLALLIFQLVSPIFVENAYAGDLTSTFIRLDRQKVSTSTGALVCATTPSSDNGTEGRVQIVFPNAFDIGETASSWTVTTSDLPAGSTAWPGIGTAVNVSGQTVTFPSSNLLQNTQYCFNISANNTLTTPSSAGSYPGFIRTQTSGGVNIDTVEFGLGIAQNDGINVTATVPANPTDFQADLQLFHPPNGTHHQKAELIYKLSYGSYLPHNSNITLEVEWDLGTVEGNSVATEEILNYLIGTATNAYNNIPPVVDTVNRRISWTFSSFPGNLSNQSVFFRLSTNDAYKGEKPVDFSVRARMLGPGTQTADSVVNTTYKYNFIEETSSSVTSTPTATPPVPTSAQTPAVRNTELAITDVDIRNIRKDSAQIEIITDQLTTLRILYGESLNNLNQSLSLPQSRAHLANLSNLKSNTRYYFRLIAEGESGTAITSDLFSLDTASEDATARAQNDTLILSSGDVVLFDPLKKRDGTPNIVIPKNTRFSFKFFVEGYETVESVVGVVRNNNVLGISTSKAYADSSTLTVTEIYPGQYIGSITSSDQAGNYSLMLKIKDFNGNLIEQEISNLTIVDNLKIVDSSSKASIEKARATFYFYNERKKIYEVLSSAITPFNNPSFSDADGYIPIVLPEGKYRAEIIAIGYKEKTVDFEISELSPKYPLIELESTPFSFSTFFEYHASNALDVFNLSGEFLDNFKSSKRFLELITFGVIILFIMLAALQLSKVFGVPIILLPVFALYHLVSLFYKPKHTYFIQGKVIDISTHVPIEGVLLHFSYSNRKVVAHTRSNSNGDFTVAIKKLSDIKITVSKRGFSTFSQTVPKDNLSDKLTIAISKSEKPSGFGFAAIAWYFESLGASFFETFLVLTIVLELIFASQFGITKTIPAIAISIGNLLLWALHSRPKKAVKTRA